jgi:hypothetical protein
MVLRALIVKHTDEASKDLRLRGQAEALVKDLNEKLRQIGVWNSSATLSTAEVMCQQGITSILKSPATAKFSLLDSGRWTGQLGMFLVRYSVDAENSFGALLRSRFQCEVACLREDSCVVVNVDHSD